VTRRWLQEMLRALGSPTEPQHTANSREQQRRAREVRNAKIMALYREGRQHKEIADKMGVSASLVNHVIRQETAR